MGRNIHDNEHKDVVDRGLQPGERAAAQVVEEEEGTRLRRARDGFL